MHRVLGRPVYSYPDHKHVRRSEREGVREWERESKRARERWERERRERERLFDNQRRKRSRQIERAKSEKKKKKETATRNRACARASVREKCDRERLTFILDMIPITTIKRPTIVSKETYYSVKRDLLYPRNYPNDNELNAGMAWGQIPST